MPMLLCIAVAVAQFGLLLQHLQIAFTFRLLYHSLVLSFFHAPLSAFCGSTRRHDCHTSP